MPGKPPLQPKKLGTLDKTVVPPGKLAAPLLSFDDVFKFWQLSSNAEFVANHRYGMKSFRILVFRKFKIPGEGGSVH